MVHRSLFFTAFVLSMTTAAFTQTNVTLTFKVGSTTNSCIFHVPSGIDNPPVVFFIHGANGSGPNFQKETKADVVADREKFIAVYPSATSNGGTGTWADMRGTSHYPFFKAVLDTLDERYGIDRNRIYMTGFSQGGFVSFVAGCSFSDIFAAIAPVSGHAGSPCTLERPVSVYLTYGAQEDKVAFVNDLNIWLDLDSCPSTPTVTHPVTSVTRVTYGPCAQETYVIMDSISGQGHQWPTKQNQAEEVWTFFKKFSIEDPTGVARQTVTQATHPVTASYASGIVRLQGAGNNSRVKVIDTKGRQITDAVMAGHQLSFTNKSSAVYMVVVNDNYRSEVLRIVIP